MTTSLRGGAVWLHLVTPRSAGRACTSTPGMAAPRSYGLIPDGCSWSVGGSGVGRSRGRRRHGSGRLCVRRGVRVGGCSVARPGRMRRSPVPAEPLRRLDGPAGDTDADAPSADLGPQRAHVIRFISVQLVRPPPGSTTPAAGSGRSSPVVVGEVGVGDVRRRDQYGQRYTFAVTQYVDRRTWLAAINRVWSCFVAPFCARTLIESTTAGTSRSR